MANTVLVSDNIGLATYNFDEALAPALTTFEANYNARNVLHDLTKTYPTVKFVAGLLMKTIMTPYQEDGFLFGGFKWISDF